MRAYRALSFLTLVVVFTVCGLAALYHVLSQQGIDVAYEFTLHVTSDTVLWEPGTHSFRMTGEGHLTSPLDVTFQIEADGVATYTCAGGGGPPCPFTLEMNLSGNVTGTFMSGPFEVFTTGQGTTSLVFPGTPGYIRTEQVTGLMATGWWNGEAWNLTSQSMTIDFTDIDQGTSFDIKVTGTSHVSLPPEEPMIHTIEIQSTDGGSTEPAPGTYSHSEGTTVNVTGISAEGYSFEKWVLDGGDFPDNPVAVVMDANHTLLGVFVDDIPPMFDQVSREPWAEVDAQQPVEVYVNLTEMGSGIANVTLWVSADNGTEWTPMEMEEVSPGVYRQTIPGLETCNWVWYKISSFDISGNQGLADQGGQPFAYHVPEHLGLFVTLFLLGIPMARKGRSAHGSEGILHELDVDE